MFVHGPESFHHQLNKTKSKSETDKMLATFSYPQDHRKFIKQYLKLSIYSNETFPIRFFDPIYLDRGADNYISIRKYNFYLKGMQLKLSGDINYIDRNRNRSFVYL